MQGVYYLKQDFEKYVGSVALNLILLCIYTFIGLKLEK